GTAALRRPYFLATAIEHAEPKMSLCGDRIAKGEVDVRVASIEQNRRRRERLAGTNVLCASRSDGAGVGTGSRLGEEPVSPRCEGYLQPALRIAAWIARFCGEERSGGRRNA